LLTKVGGQSLNWFGAGNAPVALPCSLEIVFPGEKRADLELLFANDSRTFADHYKLVGRNI
jgi:hypothetical protein